MRVIAILTLLILTHAKRHTEEVPKEYQSKGLPFETFIELMYTESTEEYNGIDTEDLHKLWEEQTYFDWMRADVRLQGTFH